MAFQIKLYGAVKIALVRPFKLAIEADGHRISEHMRFMNLHALCRGRRQVGADITGVQGTLARHFLAEGDKDFLNITFRGVCRPCPIRNRVGEQDNIPGGNLLASVEALANPRVVFQQVDCKMLRQLPDQAKGAVADKIGLDLPKVRVDTFNAPAAQFD